MIQAISSYIKDIAIYIVLITFLQVILPDGKYKSYLSFISGLILIYIMIAPIGNVINAAAYPFSLSSSATALAFDRSIMQKEQEYYEEKKKEMILEEYKSQISEQLGTLVKSGGFYILESCSVDVSSEAETFGEINMIIMEVSETEKEQKKPIIRIEKIKIGGKAEGEQEEEQVELKDLKKSILDFYNLSSTNIHITVQKKAR